MQKKHQRKGIGKKLILGINYYCKKIGVEEVFTEVVDAGKHAIEFYRSTGT